MGVTGWVWVTGGVGEEFRTKYECVCASDTRDNGSWRRE